LGIAEYVLRDIAADEDINAAERDDDALVDPPRQCDRDEDVFLSGQHQGRSGDLAETAGGVVPLDHRELGEVGVDRLVQAAGGAEIVKPRSVRQKSFIDPERPWCYARSWTSRLARCRAGRHLPR